MDFSTSIKWGIRIVTASAMIAALIFVLGSIPIPNVASTNILSMLNTAISIFYYYVPAAASLFPVMVAMWGLSFIILAAEYGLIGLRTVWKTSE